MKNMFMNLSGEVIPVNGVYKNSTGLHVSSKVSKAINKYSTLFNSELNIDGELQLFGIRPVIIQKLNFKKEKPWKQ